VPTGLPSVSTNDAIGGQYFYVEVKGTSIAQFMECSGLTSEIELITIKYEWHKKMLDGKVKEARREASIVLLDPEHSEVSRYNLFDAWVSKITISGLKAFSTEVAVEEATIVCERFERVK
jgi:hypothetical protein